MKEWKGLSFHSVSDSSHSKGVSILIKQNFPIDMINHSECDDGRKIIINFNYKGQTYSIVSVYAPTEMKYRKDFLNKSRRWIKEKTVNENCLLVNGDFNCSMTNDDRKVPSVDRSRATFRDFIAYLDIKDTYKELNKGKKCFTYSNNAGTIQSRIDYIFCTPYLQNMAKKAYVLKPPKVPDHKAVVCHFRGDNECGKGYWKFNIKLLDDNDYKCHIKQMLSKMNTEYSQYLNKRQLWDFMKITIKEESIKWSVKKSKQLKEEKNEIVKAINTIDNEVLNTNDQSQKNILMQRRHELSLKQDEI